MAAVATRRSAYECLIVPHILVMAPPRRRAPLWYWLPLGSM